MADCHALVRCRAIVLWHFHFAVISLSDMRLDVDNLFVPTSFGHKYLLSELTARVQRHSLVKCGTWVATVLLNIIIPLKVVLRYA